MQQKGVQPQFSMQGGHLIMAHQEQTGLPKVKDASMNDRDRMQDLLAQEKYVTSGYHMAMIEASHQALFDVIKQNCDDCFRLQRQVYNLMFKKGWYKLPVASAQSVQHAFQQFAQYQTQFPFPPSPEVARMAAETSGQTGGQSAGQTYGQAGTQTVGRPYGQTGSQTVGQTFGHTSGQTMGQSFGQTSGTQARQ